MRPVAVRKLWTRSTMAIRCSLVTSDTMMAVVLKLAMFWPRFFYYLAQRKSSRFSRTIMKVILPCFISWERI